MEMRIQAHLDAGSQTKVQHSFTDGYRQLSTTGFGEGGFPCRSYRILLQPQSTPTMQGATVTRKWQAAFEERDVPPRQLEGTPH
eukprot:s56_g41.t2